MMNSTLLEYSYDTRQPLAAPAPASLLPSSATKEGFLRLQLTSPDIGCGQQAYPRILRAVVTANAAKGSRRLRRSGGHAGLARIRLTNVGVR